MFEYLDVFTRKLISKLSLQQVYEFTQGDSDQWPLVQHLLADENFWSDMCYFHFKKRPTKLALAKNYFLAEYFFVNQRFEEAADLGNPMALYLLIEQEIVKNNFGVAVQYGQSAAEKYGILGHIIYIFVCQKIVEQESDISVKENCTKEALVHLALIESKLEDEDSFVYLKNSGWDRGICDQYGSLERFVTMGHAFFTSFK